MRLLVENNLDLHLVDTDSVSAVDRQYFRQWAVKSGPWIVGSG